MNILLVNRGSQGDIFPYLAIAHALSERGHSVTYSAPRLFEKELKESGVNFFLQASDDINGMLEDEPDARNLIQWTARVIKSQFNELPPLLEKHDILVAGNSEFAAPSIAEYCGKPIVRTAFGPFLPAVKIPPPVMPFPKPHPIIRPSALWALLNAGLNMMVLKPINAGRRQLGLKPIKDQGSHAPENADNFLVYSRYLGSTDPSWDKRYEWGIGGYCFNDGFPYDEAALEEFKSFVKKDSRPALFFTLGSCNSADRDKFAVRLFDICNKHSYKLVVGCGWSKTGAHMHGEDNLFLLKKAIPHIFIFPHIDAVLHHGGAGTTHSAARSGRPQLVAPLLLDQFYWGRRVFELGAGPESIDLKRAVRGESGLEEKVVRLMTDGSFKANALRLKDQMQAEDGLASVCRHIESYAVKK